MSCELTSGFDYWARGHLHMAVMHLHIKFGADIFIQSGVIDIFSKIQDGGRRHLGFLDYVNLAIRVCWQCGICALYQIGLKYLHWSLRLMHLCFRRSFDDVTRINFRFRLLVTWSSAHAVMHLSIKFGADIFNKSGVIDILPKFKMAAAAILDFQIMRIWPFRRVDSVAFVFCTKLG